MSRREPLSPLWMERYEANDAVYRMGTPMPDRPSVSFVEREAAACRALVRSGAVPWPPVDPRLATRYTLGDWTPTLGDHPYDTRHPTAFRVVPSVDAYLAAARRMGELTQSLGQAIAATGSDVGADFHRLASSVDPDTEEMQAWSILYHLHNFRCAGRRVYVLDRTLYEILRDTPLPPWAFADVTFREHACYVRLPDGVFTFDSAGDPIPQPVEGAFVTINDPVGRPGTSRELAMLVTGRSPRGSYDDNIAYGGVGVGPSTPISDIGFQGFRSALGRGAAQVAHEVPHVVLSLMLYLMSDHPDLEQIPAARLEDTSRIANAAKRRKAEQRNARLSRLAYAYVGGRLEAQIRANDERLSRLGRTLDHLVPVGSYWRQQPYGPKSQLRKRILIGPHNRGPDDFAEATHLRVAKVRAARRR